MSLPGLGALEEQRTDTEPQQMAPAGTPPATWESMAADAGIPLAELEAFGKMNAKDVARAIKQYKIDPEKANPIGV